MNLLELQKVLKDKDISFEIKDDTIFIDENNNDINLNTIKVINCKVIFNNNGYVNLNCLKEITTDITFNNKGSVDLYRLKQIITDITFNNKGNIYLDRLTEITSNIIFNNKGNLYLNNISQWDAIGLGREIRKVKIYNHLSKGYVVTLGCFVGTLAECIFAIENNKFYINRPDLKNNYINGLKLAFEKYGK